MSKQTLREHVRQRYGAIASRDADIGGCCGGPGPESVYAKQIGYSDEELSAIPDDANLGLGCGNPTAIAGLQPGEVVLDLGSGAGMDAFLAAEQVAEAGRVIGVDMTPEMLARARRSAERLGVTDRVEFREGTIEALPLDDASVDVVISNCVINLSTDKPAVFAEAFRVLKPGGRLAVSDICLTAPLPASIAESEDAWCACVSGAAQAEDYLQAIRDAGFVDVDWTRTSADPMLESASCDPTLASALDALDEETLDAARGTVWSYRVAARKPSRDEEMTP